MTTDPTAIMFGEDVAFGIVYRCLFNTPLSENGIAVGAYFHFCIS